MTTAKKLKRANEETSYMNGVAAKAVEILQDFVNSVEAVGIDETRKTWLDMYWIYRESCVLLEHKPKDPTEETTEEQLPIWIKSA